MLTLETDWGLEGEQHYILYITEYYIDFTINKYLINKFFISSNSQACISNNKINLKIPMLVTKYKQTHIS